MPNVLIVAFDGMDYEKIKERGLENIQQEEFGKIDNQSGISKVVTPELFASFITGKTWKEHGVKGFSRVMDDRIYKFEKNYKNKLGTSKGLGKIKKMIELLFKIESTRRPFNDEDLECETIFDYIEDSKSLHVPGYDNCMLLDWANLYFKYGRSETLRYFEMEHQKRISELEEELEKDPHDLLIAHFQRPDDYQDIFYKFNSEESENKIKTQYKDLEKLAGKIKELADSRYDYIIFMSDHGMPTEEEHNENAFYSCNKELFSKNTPKITDFYDKIIQIS